MTNASPLWFICKEGFRRNRFPALVLQLFAASILGLYFFVPALKPGFEAIGRFKSAHDPWYGILATVLFGGVIPWAVMVHRGRIKKGEQGKHLLFYIAFWGLQGAMVDALYTLQHQWFGPGPGLKILLLKMLVDQIPYNLIWATPNSLFLYGWKDAGFSWARFRQTHPSPTLARKFATIQLSAWVVWVPAVLMIYSLPPDLQIPLFNLVLCFFSLVLAFVTRAKEN